MTRREFVIRTAGGLTAARFTSDPQARAAGTPAPTSPIKAVAFDAFPIFDPRPIFARADAMFPGAGLSEECRTRQFEYTWLPVAAQHHADFWQVTEDALIFAANKLNLRLAPDDRAALMNGYLELN